MGAKTPVLGGGYTVASPMPQIPPVPQAVGKEANVVFGVAVVVGVLVDQSHWLIAEASPSPKMPGSITGLT